MNLREPKKKPKTKAQPRTPFPISVGEKGQWIIYTAYLTDVGSCIVEPTEITAVHSMGFFGKGSLSRSFPSFGKARYGAPPIIRNRQWERRQKWLEEAKCINEECLEDENYKESTELLTYKDACNSDTLKVSSVDTEQKAKSSEKQSLGDDIKDTESDIELDTNTLNNREGKRIISTEDDEVILDSAEEDDVCIITNMETEKHKTSIIEEHKEDNSKDLDMIHHISDEYESEAINDKTVNVQEQLLVLPDSDSEIDDYLKEIKPRVEEESFPIRESLHLTFEETFFLMFALGCLQVINFDSTLLDINSAWVHFSEVDKNFVQKYVVYHYFRSKGWVVKPGLKYGGDFLLYKQGPPFYHASYIVIIDVVDADLLIRIPSKSMRKFTWNNLFGLDRLSETAAKEILFAQVLWPSSISQDNELVNLDMLSEFTVKELLWRRWNPKQNQEINNLEEEDEDSC